MSYTLSPSTTFNSPAIHGRWAPAVRRTSDLWESLFGGLLESAQGTDHWAAGLRYDDKEGLYSIEVDCAGYKREEIAVETTDDTVTIIADSKRRGRATRSYTVADADSARATAKLEDGVLTVTIPRLAEKLPKRVEIA